MPRLIDATTKDEEFVFSYGVVPAERRLSPESRSEIRRELFNRLSRNATLRERSMLYAYAYAKSTDV